MTRGEAMRAARKKAGWVMNDLADAAGVRPVVRGNWVRTSYRSGYGYKCSVCGDIYHRSKNKLNFCPNCGADMGEES